jgi:hypothetical protein
MFGKTLRLACAAWALIAAVAIAEDQASFEFEEPTTAPPPPRLQISPSSRKVRIYRDPAFVAQAPARPAQAPPSTPAAIAHDPNDDSDMGPSLSTTGQRKPEDVHSPFADEAPPATSANAAGTTDPPATLQSGQHCEQCEACGGCSQCGQCDQCGGGCGCQCRPFWAHYNSYFAESLFLKPRGIDMPYANQLNGAGLPGGNVGVADPNFTLGYRVGVTKALSDISSVAFTYTNFQNHVSDSITAPHNGFLNSLVLMPGSPAANANTSSLAANYNINFQTFDIDFRRLFSYGPRHALNYTVGFRYATLRQFFNQTGDFTQPGDIIGNSTAVRFEGTGLKTGLDGERRLGNSLFSVYGKSFISVLFGQFHSDYWQVNETAGQTQALSRWNDDRALPILEFEIGIRWTSANGRWRSSTGYYTAYWFNTVSTPQFVQAVQTTDFVNLGQTVTFDGIVSRLEYCF